MERVQKYTKPARVFHWVHTVAFLLLLITGIILFVPAFGAAAQGSWTRVIHRIGAVIFVIAPLIQIFANGKTMDLGYHGQFQKKGLPIVRIPFSFLGICRKVSHTGQNSMLLTP